MVKSKIIHTSGKRKTAIARATLKPGTGKVLMNGRALETWGNNLLRMRIREPLILASKHAPNIDISVNMTGGGITGQADAARLAIGRALAQLDKKLEPVLLDYDRMLLVADVRRKEPVKPNSHGSARSKKQKSYR
jgi:small subunit ribosomal protein S9